MLESGSCHYGPMEFLSRHWNKLQFSIRAFLFYKNVGIPLYKKYNILNVRVNSGIKIYVIEY